MHLNIEIKAKCKYQDKVRNILKERNADFKGLDHQVDTYFNVPSGRLKTREGNIENYLIFYNRSDKKGPKRSDVLLFPLSKKSKLKKILEKNLGILTIVDKKREIYFIENVKFHIDDVKGLGTFIEIEARSDSEEEDKLRKQVAEYIGLFDIKKEDLVKCSYSDMLMKK